jgi:ribulose-5-phosphate 4-epimerase/fuculose-1-phosphate aldolase
MQTDDQLLSLVRTGQSLFARGFAFGTAGNLSCKVGDSIYATPTGSSLGDLRPDEIAICRLDGSVIGGGKPTKELSFHLAAYRSRPGCHAVVHLHSPYATAASCLKKLNMEDALPVYTPYFAMRVPRLPVISYYPPGDERLAVELTKYAEQTPAMLMRNHGSIALGRTLLDASALAEEIEETARLFFLLGESGQVLSASDVDELRRKVRP